MAHYNVTYSCGHSDRVQLFGSYEDRQRRIEWFQQEAVCPACYKAAKEKEAAGLFGDLPPLSGSPKQVAWAEKLRRDAMTDVQKDIQEAKSDEFRDYLIAIAKRMIAERTEAKWWIDNKVNGQNARFRFEEETKISA